MSKWVKRNVSWPVRVPILGQLIVYLGRFKFASAWLDYALPKGSDTSAWKAKTNTNLNSGGCNCLAGVVQGMQNRKDDEFKGTNTPTILLWGTQDRSHRTTDPFSIQHLEPNAEVRLLDKCGHFPNLEDSMALKNAVDHILEISRL